MCFYFSSADSHEKAGCLIHKEENLTYFCLSCDRKLCAECVISEHKSHKCDIFKLSHIDEELSDRKRKILEAVESTEKIAQSVEKLTIERADYIAQCRKNIKSKVNSDCRELVQNVQKTKQNLLEELEEKTKSNLNKLTEARGRHYSLSTKLDKLLEIKVITTENTPRAFKELNEMLKEVTDIERNFKDIEHHKRQSYSILCNRVPNNAKFCIIGDQTLIGIVALAKNQLLQIFDQRKTMRRILLSCIDYHHVNKKSWNYAMDVGNLRNPVVMSSLTMLFDGKHHALFAVGREVFIANPLCKLIKWDTIETISSLVIDEVPENSWITSICAHYPNGNNNRNYEFLISVKSDYLLREYNVSGDLLRVIDTEPTLQATELLKVAYCKDTIAIIDRDRNVPTLLEVKGNVEKRLSLVPKSSNMSVIDILWTGSTWLTLFTSTDNEKKWIVADFDSEGKMIRICSEGVSPDEMNAPINITRWSYFGFVTFRNEIICKFKSDQNLPDELPNDFYQAFLDSLTYTNLLSNYPFFSDIFRPRD